MRFNFLKASSLGLLAVSAIGCASSQGSSGAAASVGAQAMAGTVGPAMLQWSGRFRSQISHDPTLTSPTVTRNEASGSVVLTAASTQETAVHFTVRLPQFTDQSVVLNWTVSPGACGSGSLPILLVSQFPQLSVTSGSGIVDVTLPFAMPTSGDYHVNVYNDGADGSDEGGVLTCAALKLGRKSNG